MCAQAQEQEEVVLVESDITNNTSKKAKKQEEWEVESEFNERTYDFKKAQWLTYSKKKNINVFEHCAKIVIPINIGDVHWILCVVDMQTKVPT